MSRRSFLVPCQPGDFEVTQVRWRFSAETQADALNLNTFPKWGTTGTSSWGHGNLLNKSKAHFLQRSIHKSAPCQRRSTVNDAGKFKCWLKCNHFYSRQFSRIAMLNTTGSRLHIRLRSPCFLDLPSITSTSHWERNLFFRLSLMPLKFWESILPFLIARIKWTSNELARRV